jgi:hypothetical protein
MTITPYDENAPRGEVEQRQPVEQAPPGAETSALVLWAYEARQAAKIATSLANTSFIPASLRGKPHDVTAAILTGQELGLKPMASLRSLDIIQGVPALRAHAMRGLVQSHGHEVELLSSTPAKCVMRGRRKGSDAWQTIEWTIDRAASLGLTGKDQWKKQPQTMLVARATGEICRLIASDVLHAVPYNAEELLGSPAIVSAEVLRADAPAPVTVDELAGQGAPPDSDAEAAAQATEEAEPEWPSVAQPGGAA